MADEEGFEPPLRDYRKHDFESRAFSRSATHPYTASTYLNQMTNFASIF